MANKDSDQSDEKGTSKSEPTTIIIDKKTHDDSSNKLVINAKENIQGKRNSFIID